MKTCNKPTFIILMVVLGITATAVVISLIYTNRTGVDTLSQRVYKLQTIHFALCMYADLHQTMPPHAMSDSQGLPILSWRALLCNLLQSPSMYLAPTLPYSHVYNMKSMLSFSQSFGSFDWYTFQKQKGNCLCSETTNVFATSGEDSLFSDKNRENFSEMPDNLIIFIEYGRSHVHWAFPYDDGDIRKFLGSGVLGTDGKGVLITLFCGDILYLKKDIPYELLIPYTSASFASQHDLSELAPFLLKKYPSKFHVSEWKQKWEEGRKPNGRKTEDVGKK